MTNPRDLSLQWNQPPRRWLVTGAAGFIGSNLVERLLREGQAVVGLDNFSTGHRRNLDDLAQAVGPTQASRFQFIEGDIRDLPTCIAAAAGCDFILHQAALGSVPRSLADPMTSNAVNVGGTLNMLWAAKEAEVQRMVYAASSSTYGDHPALPKVEDRIGRPLSPYAVTKLANELYAQVFADAYAVPVVGLRYFNVFGPRQDPFGAYAAVIPRWVSSMLRAEAVVINGDGETSRDFCYVANAVQANLRAALFGPDSGHEVFNVAVGGRTSLLQLFGMIRDELAGHGVRYERDVAFADFRAGDVRHSQADIEKAVRMLGYQPTHTVASGLAEAMPWYLQHVR